MDDFGNLKDSYPNDLDKPLTQQDGPISQQLILQIAGVGEYKFRLNDRRRPWKQQTVVFSELNVVDPSLWTLHPPVIDPKRIDLDAKRNQAYIKFARAHKYLPQEGAEEEQMNAASNLTDRVLQDAANERARADQIQQEQLNRARAEADAARLETARVTAEAEQAKRQAEELKSKVQPGTPAGELLTVATSLTQLAVSMKPAPDTSLKDFLALEREREETRRLRDKEERDAARETAKTERERADKLQQDLITLRTAPPAAGTAAVVPLTETQVLEEMVKRQSLLEQLNGNRRRGSAHVEEDEDKPGKAEKFLELVSPFVPVLQTIFQGVFQTAQYGIKTYGEVAHNNAIARTGGTAQAMTQPPAQTPANQAAEPIKPTDPPPDPVEAARQQVWKQVTDGIVKLAPHLVRFLEKGKSGADLAEFIIENADEQRSAYDRMRHLSQTLEAIQIPAAGATDLEKFINACRFVFQQIPQLWAKVGTLPTMKQFLTDFYNYDEILAAQNEEHQTQ